MINADKCEHLSDFMKTQKEVIQKHLDEHKYLRHMEDKEEALSSFINDYGWIIREIYCTHVCSDRNECRIAIELSKNGDLLSNHIK